MRKPFKRWHLITLLIMYAIGAGCVIFANFLDTDDRAFATFALVLTVFWGFYLGFLFGRWPVDGYDGPYSDSRSVFRRGERDA